MLYNKIIKRGVKDTTWLHSFLESSLNGKAGTTRIRTDKMLYALKNYGRFLKYLSGSTTGEGLFYNDGKYAFCVIYYSNCKRLYIKDVRKCLDFVISYNVKCFLENIEKNKDSPCYINNKWLELKKQYIKIELENTYNIFDFSLIDTKLINTDKSQDKILEEIHKLEDEIYNKENK